MTIAFSALTDLLAMYIWPFIRITAFVVAIPAIGGALVPRRIRALLAVSLTIAMAPAVEQSLPVTAILSLSGALIAVQEALLGIAMGFVVQLVFDAVTLGAQTISMSMGLGFAVFLDRVSGVNIPVIGQLYLMLSLLIFLAVDGHLQLILMLAGSFESAPIGSLVLEAADAGSILTFSGQLFVGAMRIALPAVTTLLIVNLSFGVMSRAAPSMNLFAVGFPISMLLGFGVLYVGIESLAQSFNMMFPLALDTVLALLVRTP
ncbi:MAG: flagellar biosynthetic protein FliR [Pseudomonadota bacterium]